MPDGQQQHSNTVHQNQFIDENDLINAVNQAIHIINNLQMQNIIHRDVNINEIVHMDEDQDFQIIGNFEFQENQ